MNPRLFSLVILCLLLIPASSAVAAGQATELPSAPVPAPAAKPAQPVLSLPPGSPRIVAESKGDAPPAPVEEDFCYAPAEGLYAPQPKDPPEVWEAQERYKFAIHDQLETSWRRHMPWKANDLWIKGKIVVVRFAIMPDGSIDTPIVTLTSGRKDYDKGAMDAVTKAAPFPPLPPGTGRPQQVCMRFGYYVDPRPKEDAKPDPWLPAPKPKP
jgi:TonB family protein